MVGTGDGLKRPIRLWDVPSPYEDDRLSWPDRQALRRAGDDTELEHDSCNRADLEGPDEDAMTGFDTFRSLEECNGDLTPFDQQQAVSGAALD